MKHWIWAMIISTYNITETDTMYLLMEKYEMEVFFPKKRIWTVIKPLKSNVQDMKGTEKQVQQHHWNAISKPRRWDTTGQNTWLLQQMDFKNKTKHWENYRLKKIKRLINNGNLRNWFGARFKQTKNCKKSENFKNSQDVWWY